MNVLAILPMVLRLAAPAPMPSDTPPAFPVSVERLGGLRSAQDVIGVTLLADGQPAPSRLVLPSLNNRRQTLEFMRAHYPASMRKVTSKSMAVAWVFVTENGKVEEARLLTGSGYPALDSLSLAVLTVAEFKPAQDGDRIIGVWTPLPARIPPLGELINALATMERDISELPAQTAYTQKPVLLNRGQVEAAIVRVVHSVNRGVREMEEAFARSQRIGGKADLFIFIKADGTVGNVQFKKKTGNSELDAAATNIATMMRFAPARNGDVPVDVWLEVPIVFSSR